MPRIGCWAIFIDYSNGENDMGFSVLLLRLLSLTLVSLVALCAFGAKQSNADIIIAGQQIEAGGIALESAFSLVDHNFDIVKGGFTSLVLSTNYPLVLPEIRGHFRNAGIAMQAGDLSAAGQQLSIGGDKLNLAINRINDNFGVTRGNFASLFFSTNYPLVQTGIGNSFRDAGIALQNGDFASAGNNLQTGGDSLNLALNQVNDNFGMVRSNFAAFAISTSYSTIPSGVGDSFVSAGQEIQSAPEPTTTAFMAGAGVLGMFGYWRRRKKGSVNGKVSP